MRHDPPLPAGTPLPLPRLARHDGPAFAGPVPLAPRAIAEFNDLLHDLHPDAPHVDAEALAGIVALMPSMKASQAAARRCCSPAAPHCSMRLLACAGAMALSACGQATDAPAAVFNKASPRRRNRCHN